MLPGADPIALVGLAGHQIALLCNGAPCTDYGVAFSVENRAAAAIARVDALDVRVADRSLLVGAPVACADVPWTVAGGAVGEALQLWILMEPNGELRVPCGPHPTLGSGVIEAPIVGVLGGLTSVAVTVAGHLTDGTQFSTSNVVDVTSTTP